MSLLEVPTLTDGTPTYDMRTTLDAVEYVLTFAWNARRERWSFSINGLDGSDVLTGQTVSLGIPLNRRAVGGPPGVFFAISTSDDVEPPGLTELGARVRLLYVEASTST